MSWAVAIPLPIPPSIDNWGRSLGISDASMLSGRFFRLSRNVFNLRRHMQLIFDRLPLLFQENEARRESHAGRIDQKLPERCHRDRRQLPDHLEHHIGAFVPWHVPE